VTVPAQSRTERIFPLPLAPFEAMALYDNWPDYSMACGAIFTVEGTIDRTAFDRAVGLASARHPLTTAEIAHGPRGQRYWQESNRRLTPQWIGAEEATEFAASRSYDMSREVGVRIWVQQQDQIGKIFVEFHHTCCDGAGGMSFMDDIFAIYDADVTNSELKLPPVETALLKQRGHFESERGNRWQKFRHLCTDLLHSLNMAFRTPDTLGSKGRSQFLNRQTWSHDRLISRRIDRGRYQSIRAAAVEQGVTLNDYLVSRLFQTLQIWNERHSQPVGESERPRRTGLLRVLIPVNLRSRSDLAMPMTNRLSYGFLTRSSEAIKNDPNLIQSVSRENAHMRKAGLPRRLLDKFFLMQKTGLWPLIFSPKRCLSTVVFSNLGDPTRRFRTRFPRTDGQIQIGNLRMTSFEGTTALRPMTRAGIFFNTYGNQLTISARFDPAHYAIDDGEAFLDLFSAQIQQADRKTRRAA